MSRTEQIRGAEHAAPPSADAIVIRPVESLEEYAACVRLQRQTWGEGFADVAPASLLMVTQKIGGVCAGAFDASGRLLGFVFGLTGIRDGRPAHWSHMLAVEPAARNMGLGRRLKAFQREQLLSIGVERVFWTFDPLVARNAHLNLTRLGAEVVDYVAEMYGQTGSLLHVLGTDRLIVAWPIGEPRVARVLETGGAPSPVDDGAAPVVTPAGAGAEPNLAPAPVVRITVPSDIDVVRAESEDRALHWRDSTRRAFLWYLGRGYRVVGFHGDRDADACYYTLSNGATPGGVS